MHLLYWLLTTLIGALVFVEAFLDKEFIKSLSYVFVVLSLYSRSGYLLNTYNMNKKYEALPNKERKEQYLKWHAGVSVTLAYVYGIGYIVILLVLSLLGSYMGGHLM